jgi:hypothetical protein
MREFGSVRSLKTATPEAIVAAVGQSKAEMIKRYLLSE